MNKQQPKPKTVKEFTEEFNLRRKFTYSLRYLSLKKVKDLNTAKMVMSN